MIKALRIAAIATPLILTGGTTGIYLAVASNKDDAIPKANTSQLKRNQHKTIENVYGGFKVCHKLDQHDFYGDIRIKDEIGINKMKAVIDDEMKAKVINYVLRHMKTSEGEISYAYDEVNFKESKFYFQWTAPDGSEHNITYDFSLSKNLASHSQENQH